MKKLLFAILILFSAAAQAAVGIKIDMSEVWSLSRMKGRVICAPGTGSGGVACIEAARDYSFTAQNCGFMSFLGQRIANCIVQDDFGTRTWLFAVNNGSGWRGTFPPIKDGIFDSDIQAAGSVSQYAAANLTWMNQVFRNLFVPVCPIAGQHFGYLVERFAYDLASNVVIINPDTGELSLSQPTWPHNNCPQ